MSNSTYLCASDKPLPYPSSSETGYESEQQTIAMDVWAIPLTWLTLFREVEISEHEVPSGRGKTALLRAPVVLVDIALTRLQKSLASFSTTYPEQRSIHPHTDTLATAITSTSEVKRAAPEFCPAEITGNQTMATTTIPMLAVPDVTQALAYYRDKLGFTISGEMGEPVTYGIAHREGAAIHFLFSHHPSASASPLGGNVDAGKGGIYIDLSDVDSIARELNDRDSTLCVAPEDRDYGMRDFRIIDLNGYLVVFGSKITQT